MAWNRPEVNKRQEPTARNKFPMVGVVLSVALIVGCVCGVVYYLSGGSGGEVVAQEKKKGTIKEVKPAPAPKASEPKEEKIDPDIIRIERKIHPGTGEYVLVTQRVVKLPPNASFMGKEFPNNPIKRPKKLYDTYAENYIVGMMRTKPGFPLVGTDLPYDFDDEFKARIADPVGIKDDDTPEDIALRQQMVEFKKEAAKMIADGMTPTEIVLNERKEMNRIADMRSNYVRIICDMKKEGASQQDIDDTIEAANKILDQNGGAHIKFVTPYTIMKEKGIQK